MHVLRIDSREESELSERVLEKAQALNIKAEKEWLDIGDYVFNSVCLKQSPLLIFCNQS